jgi:hypothetical protein
MAYRFDECSNEDMCPKGPPLTVQIAFLRRLMAAV